jgi:TolB protein
MRMFLAVGLVAIICAGIHAQSDRAQSPYTVAYASFGPVATALYVADADGSNERLLLEGSVLDMHPSFAPDGRSVLFTSRRNGSADIYRVGVAGSGLERLTDDPAFDDQAVMSPNGREIAFVSSRSGQADIWLLDVTTRRLRNLTNHPAGDYRPSWSPDGAWIAFTSDRGSDGAQAATPGRTGRFAPSQRTQIFVVRADGSGLRQMTSGERSAGSATWSKDGSEIAFYEAGPQDWPAMSRDFTGPRPGTSQIVGIAIATGARRELTTGPGRKFLPRWLGANRIAYLFGDADPDPGARQRVIPAAARIAFTDGGASPTGRYTNVNWSTDGRRIVFHRMLDAVWPPAAPTRSGDAAFTMVRTGIFPSYAPDGRRLVSNTAYAGLFHNSIMVASPDGADRQVIFDDPKQNALAPVWSPDGERIAFGLGRYNEGTRVGAPSHVAVIDADGSGLRLLTEKIPGNHGFPSWSPDGRKIVYRSTNGETKGLIIIDVVSGDTTALPSGAWTDTFPAWSPRGDRILFTSDRDGDWELYTMRPDGSDLKRLTRSPGNDAHAAWSFDGEWIAFASARGGFKDEMPVGEGGGQGAGDIFVMRADGSDVRRLTDDAFEEATPAFAPTRMASSR